MPKIRVGPSNISEIFGGVSQVAQTIGSFLDKRREKQEAERKKKFEDRKQFLDALGALQKSRDLPPGNVRKATQREILNQFEFPKELSEIFVNANDEEARFLAESIRAAVEEFPELGIASITQAARNMTTSQFVTFLQDARGRKRQRENTQLASQGFLDPEQRRTPTPAQPRMDPISGRGTGAFAGGVDPRISANPQGPPQNPDPGLGISSEPQVKRVENGFSASLGFRQTGPIRKLEGQIGTENRGIQRTRNLLGLMIRNQAETKTIAPLEKELAAMRSERKDLITRKTALVNRQSTVTNVQRVTKPNGEIEITLMNTEGRTIRGPFVIGIGPRSITEFRIQLAERSTSPNVKTGNKFIDGLLPIEAERLNRAMGLMEQVAGTGISGIREDIGVPPREPISTAPPSRRLSPEGEKFRQKIGQELQ